MVEESPRTDTSNSDEVSAILNQLEDAETAPADMKIDASTFLYDMRSTWISNGGTESGKTRNSLTRTSDLIGDKNEIKSLRTKLSGKTKVYRNDADILLQLYLTHWKYVGDAARNFEGTQKGYEPFPSKDLEGLHKTLLDLMFPPDSEEFRRGVLLSPKKDHREGSVIRRNRKTREIIFDNYPNSDAIITLSRSRVVIGHTPGETIKRIAETINLFFVKSNKHRNCALIWIVDIGSREIDSQDSYDAYFNVEVLSAIFKSISIFNLENSHDIMEWLDKNAIIIIGSLRHEEIDYLYKDRDIDISGATDNWPWITAQHVLPSEIPMAWMQSGKLQDIYGENFGALDEGTFNIFIREPEHSSQNELASRHIELQYFAHGLSQYPDDEPGVARGVKLPSPHETYDQAFQIVYSAACQRLNRASKGGAINPEEALKHLSKLGFGVLRIEEFLELHKLIRKDHDPQGLVGHGVR